MTKEKKLIVELSTRITTIPVPWKCPNCRYIAMWSYMDMVRAGYPICPNCDFEMRLYPGE